MVLEDKTNRKKGVAKMNNRKVTIAQERLMEKTLKIKLSDFNHSIVEDELSQFLFPFYTNRVTRIIAEVKAYKFLIVENDGFYNQEVLRKIDALINSLKQYEEVFDDY